MARLSRFASKLAGIDREVAAFLTEFGAYQIEPGINATLNRASYNAMRDLANRFRANLIANLYAMYCDAHMLGVLHELDNGAHLTGMGWRFA